MKAVILAAGFGTRMQKAYPNLPKPMLPVGGKPLLEYTITHLKKYGFGRFYINLHYLPEKIMRFFADGRKWGVSIVYAYENPILGTAGALSNFKQDLTETFAVVYGDIFTTLDFNKMLKFHRGRKSRATLLVHPSSHPQDSDLVLIDENYRIRKFYISPHKAPVTETNLSSAAIYILEPEILKFLPKKVPLDFVEDFFPLLLENNLDLFGYLSDELTKDIGTPQRYQSLLEKVAELF